MQTKLAIITATAILMATPQMATAANWSTDATSPARFRDRALLFTMADRNHDDKLSMTEYSMLEMNLVHKYQVASYGGDMAAAMKAQLQQSFANLDLDKSGDVSMT